MITEPEPVTDRSLLAHHTFSCALPTRGGVCDCLPGPHDPGLAVAATPPRHDDQGGTVDA